MRVMLVAVGSRGDVVPFAALAARLTERGHDVVLVTHATSLHLAAGTGARLVGAPSDPETLLTGPAATALRRGDLRGLARSRQDFAGFVAAFAEPVRTALAGVDVVVASTFALAAVDVARRAGVPVVRAHLWPELPGIDGPMPLLPYGWRLPRPARRVARRGLAGVEPLLGGFDGGPHGLRLVLDPHHPVGFTTTDLGTMIACSPAVVEGPLPADVHATGWWQAQTSGDPGPLPDGPLVHVGFGSMPQRAAGEVLAAVEGACRRLGIRALLQLPGAPEPAAGSPVTLVGPQPHGPLFERVDAVVHHGGAGTTGTVLRAGRPSVVVAHLGDQFYWGHRLAALGVGTGPLPRPLLTADRLARRLDAALRLAPAARELGQRVRAEDGTGHAADLLERLVGGDGPAGHGGRYS